ncbi:MAG: hypothetical protein PF489_00515 [Salinivirgaceae bacterium]|jgi:hypothetical protein|nr:hypothetical protein [Salinivirgaceae bacterium]
MPEFADQGFAILSDYRSATFKFELHEIDIVFPFFREHRSQFYGKLHAVLVGNPYTTAITLYLQSMLDMDLNFLIRSFSTEEQALSWLKSKEKIVEKLL